MEHVRNGPSVLRSRREESSLGGGYEVVKDEDKPLGFIKNWLSVDLKSGLRVYRMELAKRRSNKDTRRP